MLKHWLVQAGTLRASSVQRDLFESDRLAVIRFRRLGGRGRGRGRGRRRWAKGLASWHRRLRKCFVQQPKRQYDENEKYCAGQQSQEDPVPQPISRDRLVRRVMVFGVMVFSVMQEKKQKSPDKS